MRWRQSIFGPNLIRLCHVDKARDHILNRAVIIISEMVCVLTNERLWNAPAQLWQF